MTDREIPPTLGHYLHAKLAALAPEARLVCVLDPAAHLALGPSLQVHGVAWPVVRYAGDDLIFRAAYVPGERAIVWATAPRRVHAAGDHKLHLSSLADVLTGADAIFDLSLQGVLATLIPGEVWPPEALEAHAALFSAHLAEVIRGHQSIRRDLPHGAPLDAAAVRALALHCLQPELPAADLLFRQDSAASVLNQYITLAWSAPWDAAGSSLLREQATLAPHVDLRDIAAWLHAPVEGLARYLYLYRLLSRAKLPNVNNQLRGLGLLPFDPQPLEAQIGTALSRWERDARWRNRVIQQAEAGLTRADLLKALELLDIVGVDQLLAALSLADTPGVLSELAGRLIPMAREAKSLRKATIAWEQHRPPIAAALPDTPFTKQAEAIVRILDEAAFITRTVSAGVPALPSLAAALDWYTDSGGSRLELAHSRAVAALWGMPDETVRAPLQQYLDHIRKQIGEYLDHADHALATLIGDDFAGYLGSPRLSTSVVRDTVGRKRFRPTTEGCLWIVVFDGMRWDTWEQVVRPRLLETFDMSEEKAYLCPLPSWTYIARTGLLAGQMPPHWKGYRGTFTADQSLLAARQLGLTEADARSKLRFFSRMESDQTNREFDPAQRCPCNVLIFNVSDDNIHHLKGSLDAVNQVVAQLLGGILDMLHALVQPADTVVLASDHGFTELDPDAATAVRDDARWRRYTEGGRHPVTYRYIAGVDPPEALPDSLSFEYKGVPEGKYTVAVGRRWFQRAESRGDPARYAHGGLSFAEMVVPGAVLRKATEERLEVSLEGLPAALAVNEGQDLAFAVTLSNTGNRPAAYALRYRANTDTVDQTACGALQPGQRTTVRISLRPVYRAKSGSTTAVHLRLAYGPADDRLTDTLPRTIPVTVSPQKGKIEISFGGLDSLDQ
ncbi:MAG TPA: PglZ domain-containing protein [Anaerolineae bacterium]|nr:PglZ domain-containing protein [Anaerolineae bacterium]